MKTKPPLSILNILELGEVRSLTELPVVASLSTERLEPIQRNHSTGHEYKAFELEERKKVPDGVLEWYKSLIKKNKRPELKEHASTQARELASITASYYLHYQNEQQDLKAYQILGALEKITGRNKLKFPEKKKFRSRLLL